MGARLRVTSFTTPHIAQDKFKKGGHLVSYACNVEHWGAMLLKAPTLAQMLYFTTTTELNLDPDLGITGTHVCGISWECQLQRWNLTRVTFLHKKPVSMHEDTCSRTCQAKHWPMPQSTTPNSKKLKERYCVHV